MNKDKYDQIREKISRHIQHTLNYCQDVSREDFFANQMLQEACIFNILQVGELAAEAIEYRIDEDHSDIEWHQMRGMRNRIVHDYEGVRLEIVWETIQNDFPVLLKKMNTIQDDGDQKTEQLSTASKDVSKKS